MEGGAETTPLWRPSPERIERAHVTRYTRWAAERFERTFAGYEELWSWSVEDLERFWQSIWDFCGVRASAIAARVLASERMPGARWFEGATLNYAENLLGAGAGRGRAGGAPSLGAARARFAQPR